MNQIMQQAVLAMLLITDRVAGEELTLSEAFDFAQELIPHSMIIGIDSSKSMERRSKELEAKAKEILPDFLKKVREEKLSKLN